MSATTAAPPSTARMGGLAELLVDIATVTGRNLRRLVRVPTLIAFATVQPVMFVLLFTYAFGGAIHPPGVERYVDYLLPGIFVLAIAFGASQTGVAIADDLATGMIDRFRALPMTRSAVLAGRTALSTSFATSTSRTRAHPRVDGPRTAGPSAVDLPADPSNHGARAHPGEGVGPDVVAVRRTPSGWRIGMSQTPRRPGERAPGPLTAREGLLYGGLPYLATGEGPPLVVFSGLTAEHANPTGLDRRFQLRLLQPLARRFTVYLVNRKRGLRQGSTIEDLAGHYAEALDRAFQGPVCIQGISTGGSIAQRFAIDHPQLVRRLVLASTAYRLSPYGRRAQRDLALFTIVGRPRRAWAATGPALAATAAGGRLMGALLWLSGGMMGPEDPSDLLATINAEDVFDVSRELHRISAPTLVIAGERDRFYSPELFRETAERIPDARLCLYPGKGHAGMSTHAPAIREILRFLTADESPAQVPSSTAGRPVRGGALGPVAGPPNGAR